FANVVPGTYSVRELAAPSGFFKEIGNPGLVDGVASGAAQGTDTIANVTLGLAANATGYNFAVRAAATLAGTVYVDADHSGTLNKLETGLSLPTTVQLLDAGSQIVDSTTTDSSGNYSFA